ncbi:MAG TPA: DUF3987 domain-containing protein [Phycisphaerae bacterium]|nr:DUF3987 domain-containing protein [Phycisphaerae bacterium]
MNTSTLKEAALAYAEHGWPVVPLHSIEDGACTCKRAGCRSPGKHPRSVHGLKEASSDPTVIETWWRDWPQANVGVVTTGMVVLDIDPRHGGDESLAQLIREHGQLPETVEALSGGGGRHLIFAQSGVVIRSRNNLLAGIDVKADGGYIVAPPSNHISGGTYAWRPGRAPDQRPAADMPTWLLQMVTQPRPSVPPCAPAPSGDELDRLMTRAGQYVAKAAAASEGSRNNAAFNLAGHLHAFQSERGLRLTETQILDLMRTWNHRNCPPLGEDELAKAVRSAARNGTPRPTHQVHISSGSSETPEPCVPPIEPVLPFPVGVMPEPMRSFLEICATAIGCDPSYVAMPMLSTLAAAIGNTRRIQLKRGWTEPAIVWTAIVGESGTLKTPAYRVVLQPVYHLQAKAMKQAAAAQDLYEKALLRYDKELSEWKRRKNAGDPPAKPEPPQAERMHVSDITVEAIAPILLANPRGLLLACDELAAWVGSFDRYAHKGGGIGADAAHWLSMHNGEAILVDRKSGRPKTIYVPSASVSVTGGIQPGTLNRAMGREHRESGLLARLLLAMPPRRPKRWTEADIPPSTEAALLTIVQRLRELQFTYGENGEPRPVVVALTPAAKEAWITFYNAHAEEQVNLSGDLSAVWSKLEGYAARLALVVHCLRWAAEDPTLADSDNVDERSIAAGVALSQWFGNEAKRIYTVLGESDQDGDRRRLIEWIDLHGGSVTTRDLTHGLRQYRGRTKAAFDALERLSKAGLGRWVNPKPDPAGGRPSPRFQLADGLAVTKTPAGDSARGGFGSGDGGDSGAAELAADPLAGDDWGEL